MSKVWLEFDDNLLARLLSTGVTDPQIFVDKFNEAAQKKRTVGGIWTRLRNSYTDKVSEELQKKFRVFYAPILQEQKTERQKKLNEEGGPWLSLNDSATLIHVSTSRIRQLATKNVVRRKVIDEATNISEYSKPDLLAYANKRPTYHNTRLKRLADKKAKNLQQMVDAAAQQNLPYTEPRSSTQPEAIIEKIISTPTPTPTQKEVVVSAVKALETVSDYAAERRRGRIAIEALDLGMISVDQALSEFRKLFLA
jgi:hypothetical protein